MNNEALEKALLDHATWLRGEGGARAYLTDANLTGAYLAGADLRGANLRGANLTGADLRDANLTDADLTGADLADADLTDAYLTGANLTDANLTDAYLADAYLADANLAGANLTRANLRGANLTGTRILCLPLHDPRGYRPVAVAHSEGWVVASGCRWFTLAKAREHWGPEYSGDRAIGDLYLAALDWLEEQPLPDDGAARR